MERKNLGARHLVRSHWVPRIAIPKHYRDRRDAKNSLDELKNQWGWGDYTSRQLVPRHFMGNLIVLFYNGWNL